MFLSTRSDIPCETEGGKGSGVRVMIKPSATVVIGRYGVRVARMNEESGIESRGCTMRDTARR